MVHLRVGRARSRLESCNAVLNHCHPERSAKERSDGARVEGPAFLRANTTTSGNPHRCTPTSSTLTTNPYQCRACLRCEFSLHVLSIFQSALNVSRCFSTLTRGL